MRGHRAPTGDERNEGREPAVPRPAATVILLRDGPEGPEALLVQRNPAARFMGATWVFPGGAVEPGDDVGDEQATLRRAAVREVREETRVRIPDPDTLVLLSRWITPAEYRIRFDTSFYAVELPHGEKVVIDGAECVDAGWFRPAEALARFDRNEMRLVLPTISHLELLSGFQTVEQALARCREQPPQMVQPQIVGSGEAARVVLPERPAVE